MPDKKELIKEHLTPQTAHEMLTEIRLQGEQSLVEQRSLAGAQEIFDLMLMLRDEVVAKVEVNKEDEAWLGVLNRIEDAESFFAMGEVWRALVMAKKTHSLQAETKDMTPVSV